MNNELTYWLTLALMRGLTTRRKNEIYCRCYTHEPRISIIELFSNKDVWTEVGMTSEEKLQFDQALTELSNNAFTVEDMLNQGYSIIPLDSTEYPKTLKNNMKMISPTVIFAKGNISMLNEKSVAIVGSRNANDRSLQFTDNVALKCVDEGRVVVSGFAKGVDREALDATLREGGRSIIVLPQGILTFNSGFKRYYRQICEGNVLVISTFAPNAGWSAGLAMARNAVIYGLADSIYVAQSDSKGGTWSGVIDGLKAGREIFVRVPSSREKNANGLLIEKGAKPVDMYGKQAEYLECNVLNFVSETQEPYNNREIPQMKPLPGLLDEEK